VFQAWDFAIGTKQQNDFTVGVTLIQDEEDCLHVVEVVRFKGDSFTIVEEILDAAVRWGSDRTAPLNMGFEDGQIYRAIESVLKKRMHERRIYPAITVLKPITDKLARARTIQGRMQQGKVSFSAVGGWFDVMKAEMLRFPAGTHDDCVDSAAWVAQLAISRPPPAKPRVQQLKSWKDYVKGH
jgi:predicted phage terminase large subunit-like protein